MHAAAPTIATRRFSTLWERGRRPRPLAARRRAAGASATGRRAALGARNAALLATAQRAVRARMAAAEPLPGLRRRDCEFEVDSVGAGGRARTAPSRRRPRPFEWAGRRGRRCARRPSTTCRRSSRRPTRRARVARAACSAASAGDARPGGGRRRRRRRSSARRLERSIPARAVSFALRLPGLRPRVVGRARCRRRAVGASCSARPSARWSRSTRWRAPMAGPRREVMRAVADPARRLSAAGRRRMTGFLNHLARHGAGRAAARAPRASRCRRASRRRPSAHRAPSAMVATAERAGAPLAESTQSSAALRQPPRADARRIAAAAHVRSRCARRPARGGRRALRPAVRASVAGAAPTAPRRASPACAAARRIASPADTARCCAGAALPAVDRSAAAGARPQAPPAPASRRAMPAAPPIAPGAGGAARAHAAVAAAATPRASGARHPRHDRPDRRARAGAAPSPAPAAARRGRSRRSRSPTICATAQAGRR